MKPLKSYISLALIAGKPPNSHNHDGECLVWCVYM